MIAIFVGNFLEPTYVWHKPLQLYEGLMGFPVLICAGCYDWYGQYFLSQVDAMREQKYCVRNSIHVTFDILYI